MATTKLDKEPKVPAYRRFVPDQVLTASQLNDVIDHFECQDRFTRICLSGVGITCGLEVSYTKNKSIKVSKGCAVTTDGDLVSFPGAVYTLAKEFSDVEAKYPHFNGVELIEILPAEDSNKSGVESLDKLVEIDKMVVVLYLEYFCKEETPCTSTDCDTQGEGQTAKIRMLLISKEDVKRISNKDNDPIFDAHNNTKKFLELPDVNLKKVVLINSYLKGANGIQVISQNSNTTNYFRLQDSYRKAMQDTTVIVDLKRGITKLFTDFNGVLNTDTLATKAATINNKISTLFNLTPKNLPLDIQYRYDLLKDLIDTYNEIKCLIFDLRAVCCPDIHAFPKHLLLAELEPVEVFLQCRHSFYPSPIIPHGKEKFEEIRSLILRIHFMLEDFKIPQSTLASIKVTPSKLPNKKLGKRALPYYYITSPNLIENWDYDKTKKFRATKNLGYQTAHLSESDAIQNPLDYDLDDYDFYRIEGHLGKDYRNAITVLDTIKSEKGLAFDIKVLSIDETIESINTNDYDCEFEDLNAVLKAWRAEQNCLNAGVSKFFSGFSLKKQGEHKYYKLSKFETVATNDNIRTETRLRESAGTTGNTSSIRTNLSLLGETPSIGFSNTGFSNANMLLNTDAIKASFGVVSGLKLTYNLDTVVLDNLEKDEDVLGSVVEKAMKEKPEGSAEDIVSLVKKSIDQDPEIANWDANNKEVAMYNAAEILAYTKVASRFIPNDIIEIDPERINNYDKTIKDLCGRVERFKKNMTTLLYNPAQGTNYKRIGHEEQYALLLNQISVNCCAAAKMKTLLAEIETRKKKILEQKLLSKFVEKHSGLEHKAGVKPGGTIVLVYKGGKRRVDPIFIDPIFTPINPINSDFARIGNTPITAFSNLNRSNIAFGNVAATSRIASSTVDFQRVNPSIADKLNLNLINPNILDVLGNRFILPPFSNITENTVVADFALPYICCSDCSPIAFIVPKATVSLRLPADFVCLDKNTKPLAFEVSPSDGVVTADVSGGINGGVTQVDGKYHFDAKLASEELFGQEIKFKVNDQFTDSKITVFKKPEFDFVASTPTFFKDNTVASVNFTVQGDKLPDGVSYEWDFGDDTFLDNNKEENPKHIYQLKLGDDGKQTFKVSLKVSNGRCTHTVEQEIVIAPVIISFNIANEICLSGAENKNSEIPFTVSPTGATVKLVQPIDKLGIKDDKLVFQPGFNAFNNPIKFAVNGKQVSDTCIPRISPQLSIVLPPESKMVINAASTKLTVPFNIKNINGFDENLQTYKWDFGDRGTGSGKTIEHTYNAPRNVINGQVLTFETTLIVTSKTCGVKTFKTNVNIRVIVPVITSFNIANEICLTGAERTNTSIPFKVTPADTKVELAQNIGKAVIKGDKLIFQPGFNAFNKPIKFAVNGKPVIDVCTPRISPQLSIVLPPQRNMVIKAGSTKLAVPFNIKNINGFDENSQTYKWDFGDRGTGSGKSVKHTYNAPRNVRNGQVLTFETTLVVTSKTCGTKTFITKVKIRVQRLI